MKTSKEQSLTVLKNQAVKMELVLAIKTKDDLITAVNHLGKVKSFLKEVQAKKKEVMESINFLLLPLETMEKRAKEIEKEIKAQMSSYQTLQEAKAASKIEKIEEKIESGEMSFEKGLEKIDGLEPEQSVATENFSLTFRTQKNIEIFYEDLIPREYLIPDMVLIRRDILAGKEIAGVKIVDVKIPVAGRL